MKKLILLVALLTLVAFVSGAMAQEKAKPAPAKPAAAPAPAPAPKLEKFSGDIKTVDAMAKNIVVAKGKEEKTFATTADTKITKGKDTLKFEDLKAGMNVSVEYKKEMDKMIAGTIKVAAPKAAKKK
jgi:Cu/Ag efflux protein CusF